MYINIYKITQCYGGAEEGGWWYNSGEFLKCVGMYSSRDRANKVASIIKKQMKEYKPHYHMGNGPHDGVDPDGFGDDDYLQLGGAWGFDNIVIQIEEDMGEDYPRYRPYYC